MQANSSVLDFIQDETARENLGLTAASVAPDGEQPEDTDEQQSHQQLTERPPPPPQYFPKDFWGQLTGHTKSVTALAVHPKGARLATGGLDQILCLWDLSSKSIHPFRQIAPAEGYAVKEIGWSMTGGHLAVATGDAVVRVLDSDGGQAALTYRGIPQVLDAAKTEGHNHGAGTLAWSPFEREKFVTGSLDGTVRVWDITSRPKGIDEALPHVRCFKAAGGAGGRARTGVTVVRFLPTSCRSILGGATDGAIHVWDFDRKYDKPQMVIRGAHQGEVTGLVISRDDQRVYTRGQDETMKMWDLRQTKAAVRSWQGLANSANGVGVCLAEDESLLLTPAGDAVRAFDPQEGGAVGALELPARAVAFPGSLQQIIVGERDGSVKFYGGDFSSPSVKPMHWRDSRKKSAGTEAVNVAVYTMDNLPVGVRATRDGEIRMLRGHRLRAERQEREPRTQQQMPPVNKRARKEGWRKEGDVFLPK